MSVMSVSDIISLVERFDRALEQYYADLRDRATNDGVRLLTYHLVRRKRRLPEVLETYPSAEMEAIRRGQVKISQLGFDPDGVTADKKLPDDTDADRLFDTAITFTETIIGLYQFMIDHAAGDDIRAFFTSLHRLEERDIIELKKMKAMHYF